MAVRLPGGTTGGWDEGRARALREEAVAEQPRQHPFQWRQAAEAEFWVLESHRAGFHELWQITFSECLVWGMEQ